MVIGGEKEKKAVENVTPDDKTEEAKEKLYTQAEVDALISDKADKISVTIQERMSKELTEKLEEVREEEKRKAKMDEDERKNHELQEERDKIKKERAALERDKLAVKIDQELAERKLPKSLKNVLVDLGDFGVVKEKLDDIEREIKQDKEAAIAELQKKGAPPAGGKPEPDDTVTAYAKAANERQKAKEGAPDLWARK